MGRRGYRNVIRNSSKQVKTIKETLQMQICFDSIGAEIESLTVTKIDRNLIRIEENPIFTDEVSYGDIIRVKKIKDVLFFQEIIEKSKLIRLSWILTKEQTESNQFGLLKERITDVEGRWEQVFGGIFVVNIPKHFKNEIEQEMVRISKTI
ncbi:DUF4265 domain-containing protein [Cohnella sp. AR92]|uniref:DUF4265 domain-containing protein n=1 Tax=Cohnella sp. AR92 TaxID=648716 RepID=UPI000F8DB975|nr:DUF4265 domain-containing protein [Cohnella sp. AR92]RUS48256.1 DUF4265 domain-containing protein [Cohnella sp. AR92]